MQTKNFIHFLFKPCKRTLAKATKIKNLMQSGTKTQKIQTAFCQLSNPDLNKLNFVEETFKCRWRWCCKLCSCEDFPYLYWRRNCVEPCNTVVAPGSMVHAEIHIGGKWENPVLSTIHHIHFGWNSIEVQPAFSSNFSWRIINCSEQLMDAAKDVAKVMTNQIQFPFCWCSKWQVQSPFFYEMAAYYYKVLIVAMTQNKRRFIRTKIVGWNEEAKWQARHHGHDGNCSDIIGSSLWRHHFAPNFLR